MEVLVLDGKNYVKASKAARDLGYTTDYVGQLCRSGQVDAHLIGRTWYVDQEQLGSHRVEKKRMSRTKAREQAKALIQLTRARNAVSQTASRNIPISYENDAAPLIPETRKLSVSSELYMRAPEPEEPSANVIENKGKKILMSGDLKIVDVTDTPLEEDTVVLRPHIMRSTPVEIPKKPVLRSVSLNPDQEPVDDLGPVVEAQTARPSFSDRLGKAADTEELMPEEVIESPIPVSKGGSKYSFFMHTLSLVIILATVLASLPTSAMLTYDSEREPLSESHLMFSVDNAIRLFEKRF